MAAPAEFAVRQSKILGNRFSAVIADQNASHVDVAAALEDYRGACQAVIFSNFQQPISTDIEEQLWNAHGKVNNRFRKHMSQMQRDGKHKAVEIRKLAKTYLEFIKSSQRFYRTYILHLDQRFGGIEELHRVAHKWEQRAPSLRHPHASSPELKQKVILSCYHTLIHLGDLSRYRASELDPKDKKNWGPAVGYYGLAAEICPDMGISHNQQAVVALADGNHLRATYHLYRSLAVAKPHPNARDNLELEFKKVVTAWDKGELIRPTSKDGKNGAGSALIAWFVRLHSKCYKGEQFAGHDELEKEVLSQLAVEVRERSLEATLQKFIIINISSEYFATSRLEAEKTETNFQSYSFFLRLNSRTFFTLLQIFQSELKRHRDNEEAQEQPNPQKVTRLTPLMRRILPGVRLYSFWFVTNWGVLASHIGDTTLRLHVQDLWELYAETLTLIAAIFPAEQFPHAEYLLEEDADTIGFKPLLSEKTKDVWYADDQLKKKWSDDGVQRLHINEEMLSRIREFLVGGLELAARTDLAPLVLHGMEFVYEVPSTSGTQHTSPVPEQPIVQAVPSLQATPSHVPAPIHHIEKTVPAPEPIIKAVPRPETSSTLAGDLAMNRMVDDLVGSDDGLEPLQEEDDNLPPTPPEQTFDDTAFINDSIYGLPPATNSEYMAMTPKSSVSIPSQSPPYSSRPSLSLPRLQPLPSIPMLPDQAIWGNGYTTSGPSSPFLSNSTGNVRSSPLNRANGQFGHSRNHSGHSSRGSIRADMWNPQSNYTVTPLSVPEQPIGAVGNRRSISAAQAQANGYYPTTPGDTIDYSRQQLLYGSPWNTDAGGSSARTPPNGQGG